VFLENPLCKLLGIRYPIIQAGMAGQTTPELVAAVSNTGGLGILGATRMTPDKLLDAVRKIKMLTAKPYGVNFWLGPQEKSKKNQTYLQCKNFWTRSFANHLVFL
jgi:nitronate monooxygenase